MPERTIQPLEKKVRLAEMSWPEAAARIAERPSVVLLPVGATEQHGRHLPLGTDSLMVEWICEQAASQVEGVAVAPAVMYGTSHNHGDFPGTVSLSLDTLRRVLVDVGAGLLGHGFDILVIVNGHGGNLAACSAAAYDLREATGRIVAQFMWTAMVQEAWRVMESPVIWHADESETSLMLAIAPELVHLERAADEVPPGLPFFHFTEVSLLERRIDLGLPRTAALSRSGTIGEARKADASKGRAVLAEAVANLVDTLNRLREAAGVLSQHLSRP